MAKGIRRATSLVGEGTFKRPVTSEPVAQSRDDTAAQLHDSEIPAGKPVGRAAKGSREGDVHRSLYAKPETFDLIRELAFNERTTAQALYREGLLLMLQRRDRQPNGKPDDL